MNNKDRSIAVPIDEQGIADYENDVSKIDRLKYFTLPADEFLYLWDCGFFDKINSEFDLLIDDYEEEIIPNAALEKTSAIFEKYTEKHKCPVFSGALLFAKECNTQMCLEF